MARTTKPLITGDRLRRGCWLALLLGTLAAVGGRVPGAPAAVAVLSLGTFGPLIRAWRGAEGTELRPALLWMFVAVALTSLSQLIALGEPPGSGAPVAGHLVYLAALSALAGGVSILNARRPGGGAWALLMMLLVVVLLIPWLEGSGLARSPSPLSRLRLAAPWSIFYAILTATVVCNLLPGRHGGGAFCMACGWLAVFLALTGRVPVARLGVVWSFWGLSVALAGWMEDVAASRPDRSESELDRLWLWFRDHWGVAWALRVQDRFNRAAESSGWPIRLSWHGTAPVPGAGSGAPATIPAAVATLKGLLRRFASARRLDQAAAGWSPCEPRGVGRS
jgi:hypothetical protein